MEKFHQKPWSADMSEDWGRNWNWETVDQTTTIAWFFLLSSDVGGANCGGRTPDLGTIEKWSRGFDGVNQNPRTATDRGKRIHGNERDKKKLASDTYTNMIGLHGRWSIDMSTSSKAMNRHSTFWRGSNLVRKQWWKDREWLSERKKERKLSMFVPSRRSLERAVNDGGGIREEVLNFV